MPPGFTRANTLHNLIYGQLYSMEQNLVNRGSEPVSREVARFDLYRDSYNALINIDLEYIHVADTMPPHNRTQLLQPLSACSEIQAMWTKC